MATSEILPFAGTDTGTNLLTQAEYLADAQRLIGNQPGIARSKLVNKALHQSSAVTAGVAKFIADNQATDITDGMTAAQFAAAVEVAIPSRAVLADPAGSSLLGFLQAGTGALATTAQSKLREVVSSNDFSATFTGASVQLALDSLISSGGVVNMPSGNASASTVLSFANNESALKGAGKSRTTITQTTASAQGAILSNSLRNTLSDFTLAPPAGSTNIGIYADASQELLFERILLSGWDAGMQFLGGTGVINGTWFNNIIQLNQVTAVSSLTRPNLDFQGTNLTCVGCDFSGIPDAGVRAAVRIRAGSYDHTFINTYFETGSASIGGGDVFRCEGGFTRIQGGNLYQNGTAANRVASYVRASGGATVVIEGVNGFGFWTNLVVADGVGTVVYIMPGTFQGSLDVTARYVETNGGKVIDLTTWDAKTLDIAFSTANYTGDGIITWTVASSANQLVYNYMQVGKMMTVNWYIQNTSTGGAASAILNIAIPNGKVAAKRMNSVFNFVDNGTEGKGLCDVLVGGTKIRLLKGVTAANWSATSASSTAMAGQFTFEVQ